MSSNEGAVPQVACHRANEKGALEIERSQRRERSLLRTHAMLDDALVMAVIAAAAAATGAVWW